jgi:hypothetical protein
MGNHLVVMQKSPNMGNEEGNVVNVEGPGVFGLKREDPNPKERPNTF